MSLADGKLDGRVEQVAALVLKYGFTNVFAIVAMVFLFWTMYESRGDQARLVRVVETNTTAMVELKSTVQSLAREIERLQSTQ